MVVGDGVQVQEFPAQFARASLKLAFRLKLLNAPSQISRAICAGLIEAWISGRCERVFLRISRAICAGLIEACCALRTCIRW